MVIGSYRFNELRRGVPRMSPALLSKRLKDLETAGIVTRDPVKGDPGTFEYRLTDAGRESEAGDRIDRLLGTALGRDRRVAR